MATPTGRIKGAGHIMRMYSHGIGVDAFLKAVDGYKLLDFKTAHHNSEFKWQYAGHDPYNHHGRFMHPNVVTWRQTNYEFVFDFEGIEARTLAWFGHDPYNYRGHLCYE